MHRDQTPPFPASSLTARLGMAMLALFLLHCTANAPPPAERIHLPQFQGAEGDTLVVFVPGILGSKLRDRATGEVLWGSGMNVLRPHDGGDDLALPIDAELETDRAAADRAEGEISETAAIEAFQVVDEVRLGKIYRVVVYRTIIDLLEDHGYRTGELADPRPGDNFFLFAYDWRRSNVAAARLLLERLEALRRRLGRERLKVNLICQSNGAYVCRWFSKYGGARLDVAEAGAAGPPEKVDVERVVLVGTANGGSLRTLRELDRGRHYVRLVGRSWRPEAVFTFRSVYEDLPTYARDLFLDRDGGLLDVDIFDAETWRRYGWSVYGRASTRRLEARPRSGIYADPETRLAFLQRMLDRGRRFQALLERDVGGFGDTRYYLVQNVYKPTPRRAVLLREEEGWATLFTGDRRLGRLSSYLNALASAPGDGHATLESQLHLSPQERDALVGPAFHISGDHFGLILDPGTRRRLIEILHHGHG